MKRFVIGSKRSILRTVLVVSLFVSLGGMIAKGATRVVIETPRGGFTTQRVQNISGRVENAGSNRALLIINGIPQTIPLSGQRFSLDAVVAPGNNMVEVKSGGSSDRTSFYADIPGRDIKVVLTWDTPTDVDLWVIDPAGERTYYGNRSSRSGGNLDVDVISGFGPETFTMARAMPGNYSVQVQYYNSAQSPVTRVNVYVILYEGTPKEKVMHHSFVMTKPHQVYHLNTFTIDGAS